MNGIRWVAVASIFAGSLVSGSAQDASSDEARSLLSNLTAFYRGLEAMQVDGELIISMGEPGKEQVIQSMEQTMRLNRPGQYGLTTIGVGSFLAMPSVYMNAGKATIVIDPKRLIQKEGVKSVPELYQSPDLGYSNDASGNVLLDQSLALTFLNKLLFKELGGNWQADLKEVKLAGEEKVGEQHATRLVVSTETQQFGKPAKMDITLWIQKGDQPFLLALEPDMSTLFPQEEGHPKTNLIMMCRWKNYDVKPTFLASHFAPPDLGDDVTVLPNVEAMMRDQTAEENPALELTGAAAPEFEFPLLGGGQAKLSDWKGSVVVLGFWAAMLGEESSYLGVLHEVNRKLHERGVQLLSVNLGDTSEVASAYLKKGRWNIPVALDTQQSAMKSYKVRSIPQTVVVGKNGEVIQVHVGTDEAFEEELIAEITRLVDDNAAAPATPE